MNPKLTAHPSVEDLRAFSLGKTDTAAAETVAAHLATCPDCQRIVASLSGDSFSERVKKGHPTVSLPTPIPLGDTRNSVPDSQSFPPLDVPPELARHPEYDVRRKLGEGGMGSVYLARNKIMDRLEVLKVVNQSMLGRAGAAERFLQEIRSAARLQHPNVVTAYSASRLGDLLVLAMEYVDGVDLAKLVKEKGPLPIPHACHYARQVALGLQHALEKEMVHRDIKPNNLILGRKSVVKILDFGLAKVRREAGADTGLTGTHVMMGTPDYMAPEQATDARSADIRADVYSLGCTLYYLLTGRPPFVTGSYPEALLAHQQKVPEPVSKTRPEVPAALAAVVARMLAKNPAERYQTPVEVARALAPFIKGGVKPAGAAVLPLPLASPGTGTARPRDTSAAAPRPKRVTPTVLEQPAKEILPPKRDSGEWRRPAQLRAEKAKQPPGGGRKVGLWVAVATLAVFGVFAALWQGGVLRVRTSEGVIVLKGLPAGAQVFVDGDRVELKNLGDGEPIEVRAKPGKRKLEIKKGGFKGDFRELWLDAGGREPIEIRLEPLEGFWGNREAGKEGSPRPGDVLTVSLRPGVEMKFAWVPPGEFLMGGDKYDNEKPVHRVTLTKGFYMGVFPVTQAQWQAVMNDNPSNFRGDDRPAEQVSWDDCQKFCQQLKQLTGKPMRLPTEAEWEYACRAGTTTEYYNGNGEEAFRKVGWYNGNSGKQTHPVGKLAPNAWGMYDMHGNVWQWCQDRYGSYSPEDQIDPTCDNAGDVRVLRGGSWRSVPVDCRAALRDWGVPALRYYCDGCRVCFFPEPLPKEPEPITKADGFVPLFDGKDLIGWYVESGDARQWAVEGGAIVARSANSNTRNYLLSTKEYIDFTLRFEFMIDPGSRGGLAIRPLGGETLPMPTGRRIFDHPMIKLTDPATFPNEPTGTTHWLKDDKIGTRPTEDLKLPAGSWYAMEVTVRGDTCTAVLAGKKVVDIRLDPQTGNETVPGLKRSKGKIGFQSHTGTMRFRRVEIKELPPTNPAAPPQVGEFWKTNPKQSQADGFVPLFNGKDLTGWKTHYKQPGGWQVENGILIGRGNATSHLYTERGDYENVHVRVEARVNNGGNSGVGLRVGFGPEFPPQNPFVPLGYGAFIGCIEPTQTGSLYVIHGGLGSSKRIDVLDRIVQPNEWFTMDVRAVGNLFIIKVNGKEVVRHADEQRFFTRGHISLQLHDPKTIIEFRKVEIKELP